MPRRNILLADHPELLEAMRDSFFSRTSFALLTAADGEQAFTRIEEDDPVLAILDPQRGGDSCCRRVKSDPLLRGTPVILIAPSGREEDLRRCREAGCDAVVPRPVDGGALVAEACRLLRIVERGQPRSEVSLPARYGHTPQKLSAGRILDLNPGGAFLAGDKLFPVGTVLVLQYTLPGRNSPLHGRARVAWVNHPEWIKASRLPSGMGLEFLDLLPGDREAIRSCLETGSGPGRSRPG